MQVRTGTFCGMCGAHCAAIVTTENGKILKWEQDKESGFPYRPCPSFKGMGNKEIAAALNIAEVTVKLHVSHIMEKLEAKDRTEAATIALQRGIISLEQAM